jgi:hypothetical protein
MYAICRMMDSMYELMNESSKLIRLEESSVERKMEIT